MGLNQDDVAAIASVLRTPMWRVFLTLAIEPVLRRWEDRLLNDERLDETERRGLVYARRELQAGIQSCYEKVGAEIPLWIQEKGLVQ